MVACGRLQLGLSQQAVPCRNELGVASFLAGIGLSPPLACRDDVLNGLALAAGRGLAAWLVGLRTCSKRN